MNFEGRKVTLHDMCLRDGMHSMRHQISVEQMVALATALDEAGIPLIEGTHGDGLGGARLAAPAHTSDPHWQSRKHSTNRCARRAGARSLVDSLTCYCRFDRCSTNAHLQDQDRRPLSST